ncbi:hypothetical protein G6645_06735 [Polynucleobacter paneuropaeus]|nr:hypothetical protein [Polynucleobacter paneuropaeus]MBT8530962.1 hypothetical protein [Polynucleobacter paneuropaeus]MBT8602481.1 hypothetical protein [Polynucleobacter paneuropaeus]MBT8624434.1 hypothetical protein [Polynucleobacter paneuropaeus]MBT8628681.1 hypothetical protein [Polynucleobacter paneuropaeus]
MSSIKLGIQTALSILGLRRPPKKKVAVVSDVMINSEISSNVQNGDSERATVKSYKLAIGLEKLMIEHRLVRKKIDDLNKISQDLSISIGKKEADIGVLEQLLKINKQRYDEEHQDKKIIQKRSRELEAKNNELESLLSSGKSEFNELQQKIIDLNSILTNENHDRVRLEGELATSQLALYKSQKDIEMMMLDYQALISSLKDSSDRISRYEKAYPEYIDYESIEILSFDGSGANPSILWCIKNLNRHGRSLSELSFQTIFIEGQPGLVYSGLEEKQEVKILPGLVNSNLKEYQKFSNLSRSDVELCITINQILKNQLQTNLINVATNMQFDRAFWRPGLLNLTKYISELPVLIRIDDVTLKQELVNTDYEHLWIQLRNISFGNFFRERFEFRIGAANVSKSNFSTLPKIEFPLIAGKTKPFDSWTPESVDQYGDKFEIRFDLNRMIMDVRVWSLLSPQDQGLVYALIRRLPSILEDLESKQVAISRSWNDWLGFTKNINNVLNSLISNAVKKSQSTDVNLSKNTNALEVSKPKSSKKISVAVKSSSKNKKGK